MQIEQPSSEQIRANRLNLRRQVQLSFLQKIPSEPSEASETCSPKPKCEPTNMDFEEHLSLKCQTTDTFDSLFQTKEKLGQGAQSIVKRVVERCTGQEYAAKIMRHQDAETILKIKQQFKLQKTLDLPTLVRAHWLFISEEEATCRLVLDLCQWRNLRVQLEQFGRFREVFAADVLKALLETCDYLHSKGICHRDIKPQNILYSLNDDPCVKLLDFGISTYKNKRKHEMWTTTGTLQYKAPQMFLGSYTNKVDVWAVGIVGYELLHGATPFGREYVDQTIHDILHKPLEICGDLDAFAQDFLRKCLQKNPKERPTAKEALKHPFMLRTNTSPLTPKIDLNTSFEEEVNAPDDSASPCAKQSPAMCIRNLEQARTFSISSLLDKEFGIKYQAQIKKQRRSTRDLFH